MPDNENYFTFTFKLDPALNSGYDQAFKQGDESWWWYTSTDDNEAMSGPAAGPMPDFAGAEFLSLHQWNQKVL